MSLERRVMARVIVRLTRVKSRVIVRLTILIHDAHGEV